MEKTSLRKHKEEDTVVEHRLAGKTRETNKRKKGRCVRDFEERFYNYHSNSDHSPNILPRPPDFVR